MVQSNEGAKLSKITIYELRTTICRFVPQAKSTAMYKNLQPVLEKELNAIREAGLFKKERIITTPQVADIKTNDEKEVINFCANNYLGLSSHPRVVEAAKRAIDTHGFGMSSVRFICGKIGRAHVWTPVTL